MKRKLLLIICFLGLRIYSMPIEEVQTKLIKFNISGTKFFKEKAYLPTLSPSSNLIAYAKWTQLQLPEIVTAEIYYYDLKAKKEFLLVGKEKFTHSPYYFEVVEIKWTSEKDINIGVFDGDVCIFYYDIDIYKLKINGGEPRCGYIEKEPSKVHVQILKDVLDKKPHNLNLNEINSSPKAIEKLSECVLRRSYIKDEIYYLYQISNECYYKYGVYFYNKKENFHSVLFDFGTDTEFTLRSGYYFHNKVIFTIIDYKNKEGNIYCYDYKIQKLENIKLELEYFNSGIKIKDSYSIGSKSIFLFEISSEMRNNILNRIVLYEKNQFFEFDFENKILVESMISSDKKHIVLRYLKGGKNIIEIIEVSQILQHAA